MWLATITSSVVCTAISVELSVLEHICSVLFAEPLTAIGDARLNYVVHQGAKGMPGRQAAGNGCSIT
jgi:hypothetical protein